MACFIVPVVEAAVVTAAAKAEEKREAAAIENRADSKEASAGIPLSRKLRWLMYMLFGGSFLLAFEHIWHGEIVAWFPFLTAISDPAEKAAMLQEMATVGISMAVLITLVWVGICLAADAILKRPESAVMSKASR